MTVDIAVHDEALEAEFDDFFAFSWEGDPYELYERLRSRGRALWHHDRLLVFSHADVKAVYRDASRFANGGGPTAPANRERLMAKLSPEDQFFLERVFEYEAPTPIRSNGDTHARLRGAVQRTFTPRRMAAMRDEVQSIADMLLDAAPSNDVVDLIEVFAYKLPLLVIIGIMGVPASDGDKIHEWANAIGANRGGVVPSAIEPAYHAFVAFKAYLDGQIDELERNPSENLLSILLDAQHEGRLTREELTSNVINLLFAGHETTTNLIANGTHSLLKQRDQWDLLVEDPTRSAVAIEELLRFEPPVQFTGRRAIDDTEVDGLAIPADTHIATLIGAANRDPVRFADPARLDIKRNDSDHLSFGFGPHYCLGTFLARLEGDIAFATLARRFPKLELADETLKWKRNRNLRGLERLPVSLRG